MFLSMGNEYNTLLVNYACSATGSADKLRFKIERHYANICAAQEASIWVVFSLLLLLLLLLLFFIIIIIIIII